MSKSDMDNTEQTLRAEMRTCYISMAIFGALFFKVAETVTDEYIQDKKPDVRKEFKVLNKNSDNSINALVFNPQEKRFEEQQFFCNFRPDSLRVNHHYMGDFRYRQCCDAYVLLGASPRPIQNMNMISACAQERGR